MIHYQKILNKIAEELKEIFSFEYEEDYKMSFALSPIASSGPLTFIVTFVKGRLLDVPVTEVETRLSKIYKPIHVEV